MINKALFETFGFMMGVFCGVTIGFMLAFVYVALPWGVP
jgi:hypothetical protein